MICILLCPLCVLSSGRSAAHRVLERYRARSQEQAALNRGLSRSMGSLPTHDDAIQQTPSPSEISSELFARQQNVKGQLPQPDRRSMPHHRKKNWASSVDLAYLDPGLLRFGALEDARRGSSALSTRSSGRPKSAARVRDVPYGDFEGMEVRKGHHRSVQSVGGAYDKLRERHKKLHALSQAMDGEYESSLQKKRKKWCKFTDFFFLFYSKPNRCSTRSKHTFQTNFFHLLYSCGCMIFHVVNLSLVRCLSASEQSVT